MKLLHLSDLHLGKRLHAYSLIEDQAYILDKIIQIVDTEQPDAVLLAGDLYDKPVPPAEAVQLLDDFLVALAARNVQVLAISGNHDSPERTAFGGRLFAQSGVHLAPVYGGAVAPVTLQDAHGAVQVYLLPFVKPAHVRRFFPEAEIASYTDALQVAVAQMQVDTAVRNVLVTHQFVTGAARCDSEEVSVGGSDNVDGAVFAAFDYVALGHLHGAQNLGGAMRYCGTPLKYSVSEATHTKTATLIELGKKGELTVQERALTPLRDVVKLRGSFAELTQNAAQIAANAANYVHLTLTDEDDIPDAMQRLRACYPYVLQMVYDNCRTRAMAAVQPVVHTPQKTPLAYFAELYEKQNGQPLTAQQTALCETLICNIWEGEA